MERKWTSLNGKEYSFTVEQVVAEFNPAFQQRYSGYEKEYRISSADAMQALITWEMHQLDPYIDGWFVPKKGGAVYIVGYMFILKKVGQLPYYDGFDQPKDIFDKHGNLIAVEVSVWRKDRTRPTTWRVEFDEFAARKKDGSLNEMWQTKGKFMLRKVGVVIPHRIAFAAELQNLYIAEEFGNDESVVVDKEPKNDKHPQRKAIIHQESKIIETNNTEKESDTEDEQKTAELWKKKISNAKTLKALEKIGIEIKQANLKVKDETLRSIKVAYKIKHKEVSQADGNQDAAAEQKMDAVIADYDIQEKVISMLQEYTPENKVTIIEHIEMVKDNNIKNALTETYKNTLKLWEESNADIKEK